MQIAEFFNSQAPRAESYKTSTIYRMGSNCDGAGSLDGPEQRLNIYALVIYIPAPLGVFLDDLRRELVPTYKPRAHVSVLPPRPLTGEWPSAVETGRNLIESWSPFNIELAEIKVFPVTNVIYLEVGEGARELTAMNAAMNAGGLRFDEPFEYHPHVTLAQEVTHDQVLHLENLAKQRWAEYRGDRSFRAERAAFVQNTTHNAWLDLAEYSLGAVAVP